MSYRWGVVCAEGRLMVRLLGLLLIIGAMVPRQAHASVTSPRFCAAIQGNGDAIFAHFHSLAHIISYYGMFDLAAGSSSASITMFLIESMLQNPEIANCKCSKEEKAQRVSLMLKSLVGFFESSPGRKEAISFYNFLASLKQIQEKSFTKKSDGVTPPQLDDYDYRHFSSLLGIFYNKRFENLFRDSPDKSYHYNDYKQALGLGMFKVDSNKVFLRPFPITFEGVATVMGWIGNFYAARDYENGAHWTDWFKACKPDTLKEKTWGQIAYDNYDPNDIEAFVNSDIRKPTACKKKWEVLMSDYRAHDNTPRDSDRINEPMGEYFPAIVMTGLVVGNGYEKMEKAKAAYWKAEREIQLNLDYANEFRVGNFGPNDKLESIENAIALERKKGPVDVKTDKFYGLPGFPWAVGLQTSPAEPSISEAAEFNRVLKRWLELHPKLAENFPKAVVAAAKQLVSVGGYADPFPSTALKLAGCENVFFITTERDSFDLVDDINNLLGGKGSNYVNASLKRGLKDSDAVWCTDWNDSKYSEYMALNNVYKLTESTFKAGFETKSDYFLHRGLSELPSVPRHGCNFLKNGG